MAGLTEYRSLEDLNRLIIGNLDRLPHDTSLVVGIPRSGMLVATLIGLYLNVPVVDFPGFISGQTVEVGLRGARSMPGRVLIVDDSVASGTALIAARRHLSEAPVDHSDAVWMVAIAEPTSAHLADIALEFVDMPRVFEWNVMHHRGMPEWAVDIDGVLCRDPTPGENDDGARYEEFLSTVLPYWRPSNRVGWLVTCRLEKYRAQTVEWLERSGVRYGELIMLDMPDGEARRAWGKHAEFKASFYRSTGAKLFVESSEKEACRIAAAAKASVYCVESRAMIQPSGFAAVQIRERRRLGRLRRRLRSAVSTLGSAKSPR